MPHRDHPRATAPAAHHQDLRVVLDWFTAEADFAAVRFRGPCTWCPRGLACTALLWAWSDEATLLGRFAAARQIALVSLGLDALTAASYQAFTKLLRAWTTALVAALVVALRRRMRVDLAERFEVAGFAAFGVDGSRLQLPRTASNEGRFSASLERQSKSKSKSKDHVAEAARRKKAECPQLWLTTTFHLGTGLPWDWRTGPTDSSERDPLRQMLAGLPAGALVVADAGFVGYQTWEAIRGGGRHLLVRGGANVRRLKGLGYARERDGLDADGLPNCTPDPGLRPRARRAGLPLARRAGGPKPAAAGPPAGGGAGPPAPGVPAHLGARRGDAAGPGGR